jgi:3,4-dihydroxy-2-butanone 4-phosphate synthase
MARLPDIVRFAEEHSIPVVTVEDLVEYRRERELMAS